MRRYASKLFRSALQQRDLCAQRGLWTSTAILSPSSHSEFVASTPPADIQRFTVGQPWHQTHPELLSSEELTPGILTDEYADRRRRLCGALPEGSLVIISSANINYMSGVIPYPYRQDPDFFYLTGLNQRGVLALMSLGGGQYSFTLFIEAANHERDRWDGASLDHDAAQYIFMADHVRTIGQLPKELKFLVSSATGIFFDTDRHTSYHHSYIHTLIQAALLAPLPTTSGRQQMHLGPQEEGTRGIESQQQQQQNQQQQQEQLLRLSRRINPLRQLMHALRLRKSPAEAALMRASAHTAATALRSCIMQTRPGVKEYELAATFEYECKRRRASRMAFPSVVAGGPDACTIHYGRNDKVLQPGHLILMDAGCELHGYCSDVTRTWPVNGRYTSPQRDVYDLVLSVHSRCVEACRPGSSIRELHNLSCQLISQGLKDLGVLPHATVSQIEGGLYRQFYWHSVGHWLGLDTHDTHLMGHDRPLQPGHVITIEPGLYIPDEERYGALRGIGVRIEDDVLVTHDGCEVLSAHVPHSPSDIEAMMAQRRQD